MKYVTNREIMGTFGISLEYVRQADRADISIVGLLSPSTMQIRRFYCADATPPPRFSDKLGPESRGGQESFQGNCGVKQH